MSNLVNPYRFGIVVGADAVVEDIAQTPRPSISSGLDLTGYSIPAEIGPVKDPKDAPFNAVGDGVADDRQAFIDCWNSLTSGGTIELSGRYAFGDNTQNDLNAVNNITVKGVTTNAAIIARAGVTTGSAFRSLLELPDATDIVLRDFEIDATNQNIGCLTPVGGDIWLVRLWVHNVGGTAPSHPNAAIKGGGTINIWNIVGCVVEDLFGTAGDPSVRGIWSTGDSQTTTQWLEQSLIEHNIVRNCGHTGIALHCDVALNTIRKNSSYDNIGAGFKPESPSNIVSTGGAAFDPDFDPGLVVQLYELNYSSGNGFHGFQPEGVGQKIFRNYVENQITAVASFEDWRRTEITENFFTNIEGQTGRGAIFLDGSNTRDRTNNLIANNTIEAGSGSPAMIHGIYVHPDHIDFSQNNDYVIEDNKIVGATGNDFESANATFDAYIAGDPNSRVEDNGPNEAGTPVVLIKPSYVP